MLNSFYIILFIISITALIIACIALVHNNSEYYDAGGGKCITIDQVEGMAAEQCGCEGCGTHPKCTGEYGACVCSPAACSCGKVPAGCSGGTKTGKDGTPQTGCTTCAPSATCRHGTGLTLTCASCSGTEGYCSNGVCMPGCGAHPQCTGLPACVCSNDECTCEAKPPYCEKVVTTGSGLAPQSGCKQCSPVACGWSGSAPASNLSCNPPCDDNVQAKKCDGSGHNAKCIQDKGKCSKYACSKRKGDNCAPDGQPAAFDGCPGCFCTLLPGHPNGGCCTYVEGKPVTCKPTTDPGVKGAGVCAYS